MQSGGPSCDAGAAADPASCPFLRSISVATSFDFSSTPAAREPVNSSHANKKGPIFEDDSSFELAFKLFHGETGVVPLAPSRLSLVKAPCAADSKQLLRADAAASPLDFLSEKSALAVAAGSSSAGGSCQDSGSTPQSLSAAFSASPAASISLSMFGGGGGPFGFDALRDMLARQARERAEADKQKQRDLERGRRDAAEQSSSKDAADGKGHEALGDEWLTTGKCPIARSYRAFSGIIPAMAAAFKPPAGVKYVCPPAIVALRAAVAKHPTMQALRPQALQVRVLAIGTMGMFLNIPLGAWREHYEKFSPQWILVVHASVPVVAILRKAALIPRYAMAFTIAASILGQAVGSRMERKKLAQGTAAPALKIKTEEEGRSQRGRGAFGKIRGMQPASWDNSGVASTSSTEDCAATCYSSAAQQMYGESGVPQDVPEYLSSSSMARQPIGASPGNQLGIEVMA